MIVPSRWFTGGRELNEFKKEIHKYGQIKILIDYMSFKACFPEVEIKGDVYYFFVVINNKKWLQSYFN